MARHFGGTDRYQVVRPLGEGSFGTVYDVLDRERGIHVALKLLTRFDATTLYRFKGEFRSFADVHHTNLVQLYELASDGDDWFFTMELLSGIDWLAFVRGGQASSKRHGEEASTLDPPAAAATADIAKLRTEAAVPTYDVDRLFAGAHQLALGVCALHGAGIVHRDVKPSNVLVADGNRVVLVDFGLARPMTSGANGHSTQTGMGGVGTPAYMAPEQAMGGDVTGAADWYALGAMLFEALTGRLPFDGKPLEIIAQKQARDAPRPLDLAPGTPPELDALCSALLARDPSCRPTGSMVVDLLGAHRPKPRPVPARKAFEPPPVDKPLFVGRRHALHDLEAAFRRAAQGATVTALVGGHSGIGKTALVRALIDDIAAPSDALVLAGRCYEREAVTYKAFDSAIDALSRYLVQLSPDMAAAVLPRDAAALARIFPVLDRVPTIAQAPRRALQSIDAQRLRTRAFGALRELLARAGDRRPIVLFLDDFQWADEESLALLRDLQRGDPAPAMLVVITYRSEDVGRSMPLDGLLASARESEASGQMVVRVQLDPLTPSESTQLAASALGRPGDHPTVSSIAAESAGSPFFLGELVQFALSEGKSAKAIRLATVLEERLAHLGAQERFLLEILACAGTPIERRVAAQAAQLDAPSAEPLLRALHRAKLVRTAGSDRDDLLECFHNRIREAVVAALTPEAKQAHHQRIAAALQSQREPDPEALFLHYEAAGLGERAAEYALASAQRAERALAFEHAARLYQSALDLLPDTAPDRNDILVRRAETLRRAGRGVESADAYLAAIEGANPHDVLAYRQLAAEQLLFCGQLDRGLRLMQDICDQVGVPIPRSRLQAILQIIFLTLLVALKGKRWRARDASTVTAAELTRADVCWSMGAGLSLVDQVIARPLSLRAMLTSYAAGDGERVARALSMEAGFRSKDGGPPALRKAEALFAFAKSIPEGNNRSVAVFRKGVEGWAQYFFGNWRAAKPLLDEAFVDVMSGGLGTIWERDTISVYGMMVRIYLGEIADLSRIVEQRLFDARNRGDLFAETIYLTSRVNVRWLLTGAPTSKRREVDDALRKWGQPGRFQLQHWYALQSHAQVDLYEGEPLNALRRVDEAWPALRRSFLLSVQNIRMELRATRGFAATRLAAQGADKEAMLHIATQDAAALGRERAAWGEPMELLIRAGIRRARGEDATASLLIEEAIKRFDAHGMAIHAASARLWRALVAPDEAGVAAKAEAETYFRAQGIRDPKRTAAVFAPCF